MLQKNKKFSLSYRALRATLILLVPLVLAALACNFQNGDDPALKETDIAIGIQQTLIAQTATALEAGVVAPPAAAAVQTLESQPEATTPPLPSPTEAATQPVIPTNMPEPSFTPTTQPVESIQLEDWKLYSFIPINSGCKFDEEPCWLLKLSGSGLWKNNDPVEGTMTTRETTFIDPTWENPALVFWHNFGSNAFDRRVNLQIDGKWSGVQQTRQNTAGWAREVIDLKDYKGKNINVSFLSSIVVSWLTPNINVLWYIQDVQIVPNYQPEP